MADQFFEVDTSAFERTMGEALRNLGPLQREALREIALDAEGQVKERFAPVDDGFLQGSVTGRVDQDGQGFTLRTTGIDYAAKQETDFELHHPDRGPTGERGADYIGRGIRHAADHGGENIEKMHRRVFGTR